MTQAPHHRSSVLAEEWHGITDVLHFPNRHCLPTLSASQNMPLKLSGTSASSTEERNERPPVRPGQLTTRHPGRVSGIAK
jgi:hypothetical protein